MLPQQRHFLNLSRRPSAPFVLSGMRKSSIHGEGIHMPDKAVPKAFLSSTQSRPSSNRTWDSSRGITFSPPTKTTWGYPRGICSASSVSFQSVNSRDITMLSSNLTSQETASKPARHVRSHVSSLSSPLVLGQFPALVPSMQDQPTAAHVVDSSGTTLIRTVEEPDIDLITHTPDIKSATTSTCSGSNLKSSQKLAHPSLVSHSTSNDAESLDRIQTGFASTSLDQLPIEHCSKNDDLDICSPLGFHIPKDKLLDAMFAEPNSPGSYWQHTLYRGPKGNSDNVKVHYCKNKEATERVAQLFLDEEVIGFDIEWKSNSSLSDDITKTVSLIQIASESRIALFHLARYPNSHAVNDFVAPTFKTIMESKDITKVGVAIKGDCTRLRKYLQIESRGTFELSHLYKLVKFSSGDVKKINKTLVSLAQQVREHFRLPLFKGEVRSSDWSQELDYRQVQYAASDSYAGFQLYHLLEAKRKALDPTPPRPAYAELNIPIRLANGQTVALYDAASEAFEDKSHDCPSDPAITAEELALEFQNTVIEEPGLTDRSPDQISGQETNSFSSSKPPSSGSSSSPTSSPAYPTPSKPFSKTLPEQPLDPQIIEANDWAMNYINTRIANGVVSTSRASKAELRAYYLWDHQYLEPHEIAALLRDPPLETSTVSGYIFRAIRAEHLRFDLTRARRLIPLVHVSSRWRYEAMVSNRTKKGEEATNAQDRPGIQSTSGGEDNGRTS